ncbi:MAG: carbohydrate kinase family protein [Methanobacteriales archaeon HGW-Methanobacteriales-1]|jgi:ribokinase|nr:MAG: carbohydrate kinase family protein [Methanobacteriales archaeon HGW-Methanobacteriales-1]
MDFILKVPQFVELDGEMYIEEVKKIPGGSALNFAMKTSLNGLNSGIIAKIGNDHHGEIILDKLSKRCIETSRIEKIDDSTGMAFISVDGNGKRSIYSFMGANEELNLSKEDFEYITSAEITHLSGTYWEVAYAAAKHVNTLSFAPGALLSTFGLDKLEPVLSNTDILFLNEKEVKILTGLELNKGIDLLIENGIPLVVITLGDKGSILRNQKEMIKFPAKSVQVVDTTGAGDTFAAGFISQWFKKKSLNSCLKLATSSAADCICKLGGI